MIAGNERSDFLGQHPVRPLCGPAPQGTESHPKGAGGAAPRHRQGGEQVGDGKGFPDLKLLDPLAQVLNVSLVELLQGERTPSPPSPRRRRPGGGPGHGAVPEKHRPAVFKAVPVAAHGNWSLVSALLSALGYHSPGSDPSVYQHRRDRRRRRPTQIYVSASDTAFPPQFYLLTQLAALIVCIVLAVQVWRLERETEMKTAHSFMCLCSGAPDRVWAELPPPASRRA